MTDKQTTKESEDWQYSWKDHEAAQLRGWLTTTPAQRLTWLEEAIKLAHKSGALQQK